jgi:hypothetical protein
MTPDRDHIIVGSAYIYMKLPVTTEVVNFKPSWPGVLDKTLWDKVHK